MASFYAEEQFPRRVVKFLRSFGHSVLTVQEADNFGLSDDQMLAFAIAHNRAVLTLNRKDFIQLHRQNSKHKGIIVCSRDDDWQRQAERIDAAIASRENMDSQLIRVNQPSSV